MNKEDLIFSQFENEQSYEELDEDLVHKYSEPNFFIHAEPTNSRIFKHKIVINTTPKPSQSQSSNNKHKY